MGHGGGTNGSATNWAQVSSNGLAVVGINVISNLTASRVMVTGPGKGASNSTVTVTELEYLGGVTSGLQAQINAKKDATYEPTYSAVLAGETSAPHSNANFVAKSTIKHNRTNLVGTSPTFDWAGPAFVIWTNTGNSTLAQVNLPTATNGQTVYISLYATGGPWNLAWPSGWTNAHKRPFTQIKANGRADLAATYDGVEVRLNYITDQTDPITMADGGFGNSLSAPGADGIAVYDYANQIWRIPTFSGADYDSGANVITFGISDILETVETTGATPTLAWSYAITTGMTHRIEVDVFGGGWTNSADFHLQGLFRRGTGAAALVGSVTSIASAETAAA
jgi:hypothetical protein